MEKDQCDAISSSTFWHFLFKTWSNTRAPPVSACARVYVRDYAFPPLISLLLFLLPSLPPSLLPSLSFLSAAATYPHHQTNPSTHHGSTAARTRSGSSSSSSNTDSSIATASEKSTSVHPAECGQRNGRNAPMRRSPGVTNVQFASALPSLPICGGFRVC